MLGSASPDLLRESSEALTGRISYNELTPLNILEIPENMSMHTLWVRGGFPEPLLAQDERKVVAWHRSFITTYIERELPALGLKAASGPLQRFVSMLSHKQGGTWNVHTYANSLGINRKVVEQYLDYLEKTYLVRRLLPFHTNAKKRLVKAPKIYIRDSGIVHHMLGLNTFDKLMGHTIVGNSWENFVIEQIISATQQQDQYAYYYYQTQDRTECDLILAKGNVPVASIEVKLTSGPKRTKSFCHAIQDLGTSHNFIIIPECKESYRLSEEIRVCSVVDFLRVYLPKLEREGEAAL